MSGEEAGSSGCPSEQPAASFGISTLEITLPVTQRFAARANQHVPRKVKMHMVAAPQLCSDRPSCQSLCRKRTTSRSARRSSTPRSPRLTGDSGRPHAGNSGPSMSITSYVPPLYPFSMAQMTQTISRETVDFLGSISDLRSSRTSCTWQDMTPVNRRSQRHAEVILNACCHFWDASEIVSFRPSSPKYFTQYPAQSIPSFYLQMESVSPCKQLFCCSSAHGPTTAAGGMERRRDSKHHWLKVSDRPNITIFFTVLAVAVSFAWLGVKDPSKWQAGVVLYILGRMFFSVLLIVLF